MKNLLKINVQIMLFLTMILSLITDMIINILTARNQSNLLWLIMPLLFRAGISFISRKNVNYERNIRIIDYIIIFIYIIMLILLYVPWNQRHDPTGWPD